MSKNYTRNLVESVKEHTVALWKPGFLLCLIINKCHMLLLVYRECESKLFKKFVVESKEQTKNELVVERESSLVVARGGGWEWVKWVKVVKGFKLLVRR